MKKVLVALAMVMGLGSSVAFAYVVSGTQSVEQTQQNPQDEFTKVYIFRSIPVHFPAAYKA
jgi:hypothetical protein